MTIYPSNSLQVTAQAVLFALVFSLSLKAQSLQENSSPLGMYKLGAYDSNGNYLGLQSNSDTLISLPFTRAPEFLGTIQSAFGNTLTVGGTPSLTANQFVYVSGTQPKSYYVLIGAGPTGTTNPKEGCIYAVTANTASTLTVSLNGDNVNSIPAGSAVSVIPYWTFSTLFPASDVGTSFTATTSTRNYQTQILIPNYAGVGTNLAYSGTYYFINSGANVGWRLFGDAPTTNHGDDILPPDGYFVVRNSNNAPTLPFSVWGSVVTGKVTTPQETEANISQDNPSSMIRPIDVALNGTGLSPTNGSFMATTSTRSIKDEFLIFNNAAVSFNKAPSATYFYMNGAWRLFSDSPTVDHGTDIIPAGSALIVRKASSGNGQTAFWSNSPTFTY